LNYLSVSNDYLARCSSSEKDSGQADQSPTALLVAFYMALLDVFVGNLIASRGHQAGLGILLFETLRSIVKGFRYIVHKALIAPMSNSPMPVEKQNPVINLSPFLLSRQPSA